MAKVLTGSFKIEAIGNLENDPALGVSAFNFDHINNYIIANGTAAGQSNMVWVSNRTLAASTSEILALTGSLTDQYGATITFTRINGIIISANSANTNLVQVGGASTNTFINWVSGATSVIQVRPGGVFSMYSNDATGYAVTASTGDKLQIANSGVGTSVNYDIILIGCV